MSVEGVMDIHTKRLNCVCQTQVILSPRSWLYSARLMHGDATWQRQYPDLDAITPPPIMSNCEVRQLSCHVRRIGIGMVVLHRVEKLLGPIFGFLELFS